MQSVGRGRPVYEASRWEGTAPGQGGGAGGGAGTTTRAGLSAAPVAGVDVGWAGTGVATVRAGLGAVVGVGAGRGCPDAEVQAAAVASEISPSAATVTALRNGRWRMAGAPWSMGTLHPVGPARTRIGSVRRLFLFQPLHDLSAHPVEVTGSLGQHLSGDAGVVAGEAE